MSRTSGDGGLWLGLLAIAAAVGVAIALTVGSDELPARATTPSTNAAPAGSLSPGLSTPGLAPTAPTPTTTPTKPNTTPTAPATTTGGRSGGGSGSTSGSD